MSDTVVYYIESSAADLLHVGGPRGAAASLGSMRVICKHVQYIRLMLEIVLDDSFIISFLKLLLLLLILPPSLSLLLSAHYRYDYYKYFIITGTVIIIGARVASR